TAADPEGGSPWVSLPKIEAARPYAGKLTAQAQINELQARLQLEGTFTVSTKDGSGNRLVTIQVSTLKLDLGNRSLTSAPGDVDVRINAQGRAVLQPTGLSSEVASVLKALEPFSRGFLTVETSEAPAREWAELLQQQLNLRDARGECRGE